MDCISLPLLPWTERTSASVFGYVGCAGSVFHRGTNNVSSTEMGGCLSTSDGGPPADFSLGEPEGFRKVQGWDAEQQKIVREGETEASPTAQ